MSRNVRNAKRPYHRSITIWGQPFVLSQMGIEDLYVERRFSLALPVGGPESVWIEYGLRHSPKAKGWRWFFVTSGPRKTGIEFESPPLPSFRQALRAAARELLMADAEHRLAAPIGLLNNPAVMLAITHFNMDRELAESLDARGALRGAMEELWRKV